MNNKLFRSVLFFLCITMLMLPGTGFTQSADNREGEESLLSDLSINGYFENQSAYRVQDPNRFSQFRNRLQVETKGTVSESLEYFIQLRGFADAMYGYYEEEYPETVRDQYGSSLSADNPLDEVGREFYIDILLDETEIRLGKQQVVWGEAIGLRITDVVNPQDYRDFILDDFIDSRIPTWMVKVNYFIDDWNLEFLWIPIFEPDRAALPGSDWVWTFNAIDAPGTTIRVFDPEKPETELANSEAGIRLSGLAGGWNLTASYLYVWDDAATRHVTFNPMTSTLDVTQQYHRLPLWGFTFANAFGSFVPRGEFSYAQGKQYSTADTSAEEGLVQKDYFHYMLGTDYSLSNATLTLQWVQKIIMDYDEGIYEPEFQTNYSLWIQANFVNETLKPELLAIFSPSDEGWLVRPKVAYNVTDAVTVTAGADILSGPARSFFGQFEENDRVYAKFRYSF